MFEKSTIEAYRQVKAPDGLKERVVSNASAENADANIKRLYKTLSLMAACLVLIFSVAAFGNQNRVSIMYDGEKLTGSPVSVISGHSGEAGIVLLGLEAEKEAEVKGRGISKEICIPLELHADKEMTISVSAGELVVFDAETGESLSGGTAYQQMDAGYAESAENSASDEGYTVSGTVMLDWYVESGQEAKLYLTSGNKEITICLCYDESEEAWVIFQEQQ